MRLFAATARLAWPGKRHGLQAHLMALSLMSGSSYLLMMALNLGDLRSASRLGSLRTLLYCSNPLDSAVSSASSPGST